jgi:bifunctional DNA-binding transcriptional regulator/antitoxin component of YhaV-PrlF toxin-antitoxin module
MNNVYLTAAVNKNGALTIPAFAVRGMGYEPGDKVNINIPLGGCPSKCEDSELLLSRGCGAADNYTTDGEDVNIPARFLAGAGIAPGSEISVLSADGALVIAAAANGMQRDFTDEIGCFLEELGYDPETVDTAGPSRFNGGRL